MFLSRRADDSGDRSPYGSFWFSPVPMQGGMINVSGDGALRLTAVYRCVRLLSDSVSMLPFVLYRRTPQGGKERITDHWLYRLFAHRPNAYMNPVQFRALMQAHVELRGNAYAYIVDDGRGAVTDLIPLHPDQVMIEMVSNDNWRYRYRRRDGTEQIIPRTSMYHRRGLSLDGIVGINPIAAAREAVSTGIAAQDYGMRFFQNDARPGGWIEMTRDFKDDETRKLFREQWQQAQTGKNKSKTAVLEFGAKFHEVKITNADAQFIESKKFTVTEVARLYGVPPHKVGDLDRATFSNIEQQSLDFVNDAVMPRIVNEEAAIKFEFLDPEDGLEVEFPATALLRGDSSARRAYYHGGILDGWMTRNEARIAESLNPLDGLDEPLRPLNMVEESAAETLEKDSDDPQLPLQRPMPGTPNKPNSRFEALAHAAAERIARKETNMVAKALSANDVNGELVNVYSRHADFVEAALSIPRAAAVDYCAAQIDRAASLPADDFARETSRVLYALALDVHGDNQ